MIVDYQHASVPCDAAADICIIGAGAAGLTIAHALIGARLRVLVLESGGFAGERSTQTLAGGRSAGGESFDAGLSRLRAFGGSCNLWGGGCVPLSRLDLAPREWVESSGWPLSFDELEPYYRRARVPCELASFDVADGMLGNHARAAPDLGSDLVNCAFARTHVRFGEAYRGDLERAAGVTVLLHANALELEAVESGAAVGAVRIAALEGKGGRVTARLFVLACGGIENARLLLLSDRVVPCGLGNDRDLVGRYFMDHPAMQLGTVHADAPERLTAPYLWATPERRAVACTEICLAPHAQRRLGVLNSRVHPIGICAEVPRGVDALRRLRARLKPARRDDHDSIGEEIRAALRFNHFGAGTGAHDPADRLAELAWRVLAGCGDLVRAQARKRAGKRTVDCDHISLAGFFEQAPNRDSRVRLADERDALGQRKVAVEWRLTALDRHTYRTAAQTFGAALARALGGEFRIEPWLLEDGGPVRIAGTAHHLGTTRMAHSPHRGVVDGDARVHGVDNLYVAGSSVFPTGGWAFPTFTIVALALRLADRLRRCVEPVAVVS